MINQFANYLVALCFVAFTLSSCSSEKPKEEAPQLQEIPVVKKKHVVEIIEMKFDPAEVVVAKGDTVLFINHDMVNHDITEETTNAWTSSAIKPEDSWSMVADSSCNYYCSIHKVMKGKIIVR
jgi:plastocyanin